jgi:hypothetical protein
MKYFTISELLKSDTALKHNLWNGANLEVEENLRSLVERVLDPLREAYGKPIRVTSGYRCPQLNRLVGGAPNSQHMRGEAADIVAYSQSTRDCGSKPAMRILGEENLKLGKLIEQLGNFDQLIYEQCDKQGNPRWIHVSWKRNRWNRKQVIHT